MARQSGKALQFQELILVVTGLLLTAGLCFLAANLIPTNSSQMGRKKLFERQLITKLSTIKSWELTRKDQQELLIKLLEVNRPKEAIKVLDFLISKESKKLSWRILRVELNRHLKNLDAAKDEVNILLKLHPNNLDVIELMALIEIETKREENAVALIEKRFESKDKGDRLKLGLLLADSHLQNRSSDKAKKIYLLLSKENPDDQRPLLALAFLHQELGEAEIAQNLLRELRRLRSGAYKKDPFIDELAGLWGINSARDKAAKESLRAASSLEK